MTIQDAKIVSNEIEKGGGGGGGGGGREGKINKINKYLNKFIYNLHMFTLYCKYCLVIGKAFAWKVVTDSALTAELGRLFQRGITSGKKENLYALVRAKICLNL